MTWTVSLKGAEKNEKINYFFRSSSSIFFIAPSLKLASVGLLLRVVPTLQRTVSIANEFPCEKTKEKKKIYRSYATLRKRVNHVKAKEIDLEVLSYPRLFVVNFPTIKLPSTYLGR